MSSSPTLYSEAFGPKNAPTIVFLHGGGVGGWMWQPVIQNLSEYHCLTPDQPEHGNNRQVAPFSMQLAAEKAAELIRAQAHGGKALLKECIHDRAAGSVGLGRMRFEQP